MSGETWYVDSQVLYGTKEIFSNLQEVAYQYRPSETLKIIKEHNEMPTPSQGPAFLKKDRYLDDSPNYRPYNWKNSKISFIIEGVIAIATFFFLSLQLYQWYQARSKTEKINHILKEIRQDHLVWRNVYEVYYPEVYRQSMEQAFSSAEALLEQKKPVSQINAIARFSLVALSASLTLVGTLLKRQKIKYIGIALFGGTTLWLFISYFISSYSKWLHSTNLEKHLHKMSQITNSIRTSVPS